VTRFAWRQFRTQALIVAGILIVLGIALALDGSHLVHLYDTTVAMCTQHNDCSSVTQNFQAQAKWNHALDALMLVAPALIGVFWGAPLVARELETRTNQLAWTQSVTRSHWFLVKAAVVGAASVITAGLLSLMVTWWAAPYDRLIDSPYTVFDRRDVVPIAYALFAFALGVTFGTIIRRTLPAMAVTVAVFAAIRIEFGEWIRPRLFAPLHATGVFTLPTANSIFITPGGVGSNDWLISEEVVTSTGRVIGYNGGIGPNGSINFSSGPNGTVNFSGVGTCPNKFPSLRPAGSTSDLQAATQRCVESFHLHTVVTYLPSSRYWALQWSESGIFVFGAVVLLALSLWWVRRRIA
jgi:hypothetical protein